MSRKLTRTLLGVAVLGAAVACTVNLSFSHAETTHVVFTGAAMDQTIPIDLSTQPEVQQHKANVEDITLDYLDATVTVVGSGNTVTSITGTMKLRPDGGATDGSQDVSVGALTAVPVTVGSTVHLVGSPALDALVLNTIKGSGKATAFITGTAAPATGAAADFTLSINFHISMAYSP